MPLYLLGFHSLYILKYFICWIEVPIKNEVDSGFIMASAMNQTFNFNLGNNRTSANIREDLHEYQTRNKTI